MEKNIYKNKKEKIKFNTYYIYSDEEKNIRELIGIMFKDYLELEMKNGEEFNER